MKVAEPTYVRWYEPPLPEELLVDVLLHGEGNPRDIQKASKRFQNITRDPLWRAKWLMQHYEPYQVVFEALARPRICTPQLIAHLRHLEAPLSRNVIQLLQESRIALIVDYDREFWGREDDSIRWGLNISRATYAAVMQWATATVSVHTTSGSELCPARTYAEFTSIAILQFAPGFGGTLEGLGFTSEYISLCRNSHVLILARRRPAWLSDLSPSPEREEAYEELCDLFDDGFMPLELSYDFDEALRIEVTRRPNTDIMAAIQKGPRLLGPAIRNGEYKPTRTASIHTVTHHVCPQAGK